MYNYIILCQIYPKSGFDLARHNRMINLMGDSLSRMEPSHSELPFHKILQDHFDDIRSSNDGYIVSAIPITSDNIILDPEKEVMPTVRKKHPEAVFSKCIALFKDKILDSELTI